MVQSGASSLLRERPFPGLRPFHFEDHQFFFGREEQFYDLYRLLDLTRFVAVIGSSGCGKSSLVRAGLFPLLTRENDEAGGRRWRETSPEGTTVGLGAVISQATDSGNFRVLLAATICRCRLPVAEGNRGK